MASDQGKVPPAVGSDPGHVPEPKNFEPKTPKTIDPPKDDPITVSELAEHDGSDPSKPVYVAIKGDVYDVSSSTSYIKGGPYHVFAGKDASRALALSSVKAADVSEKWEDLDESAQKVLNDWITFFSKRYNVVGKVSK